MRPIVKCATRPFPTLHEGSWPAKPVDRCYKHVNRDSGAILEVSAGGKNGIR